jgi:hypothetical protein
LRHGRFARADPTGESYTEHAPDSSAPDAGFPGTETPEGPDHRVRAFGLHPRSRMTSAVSNVVTSCR